MTTAPQTKGLTALGAAAVCFYAVHAGQYLYRRQPENLLWICHLGSLLVGVALLTRQGTLNAIGTLWLLVGLPLWVYDLTRGSTALWTSILTHLGGPVIGLIGVRKLGVPTGMWWKSLAGLAPVYLLSRWLTPPAENINLSHAIYPGSERHFPNYLSYVLSLAALYAISAGLFQVVARRLGCKPPERA